MTRRPTISAGHGSSLMDKLLNWREHSKEEVLGAFEAAMFGGIKEMRASDRLFNAVAPLAAADMAMCLSYRHAPAPPLPLPLFTFSGADDIMYPKGEEKP
jgi:surfactin synthase thioesterase subunit